MAPTIVFKDGKLLLVTGSPGGSRIITTVLQVIVNVIDHGMSIADAVAAPRIHHQWLPDEVFVERGLPEVTMRALEARGHKVTPRRRPARRIPSWSRRADFWAPPMHARAARWRRGIDEFIVRHARA